MPTNNQEKEVIITRKKPIWKQKYGINYGSLHKRLYRLLGSPKKCSKCGTTTAKRFEWANKTGKYDDPKDFIRLCTLCHKKMDGGLDNLLHKGKSKIRKRKCLMCGKLFQPNSANHTRCGSKMKKIGCAYKRGHQYYKQRRHMLSNLKKQ